MTIGIAVVAVSFLVVEPASTDDDAGPSMLMLALVGLALVALGVWVSRSRINGVLDGRRPAASEPGGVGTTTMSAV